MNVSLAGKSIVITGGTGALGSTFVKRAVEEKAQVYFTYHKDHKTADQLTQMGAIGYRVDLSQLSEIKTFADDVRSKTKSLDALVLNAGIVRDHTLQNMAEAEWNEVMDINLRSAHFVTKSFVRLLLKSNSSKVLFIISQTGLHGSFGQANYAASKGALIGYTKSLAKELGTRKISVNALNPGFMKSKMTDAIPADAFKKNLERSVFHDISNAPEVADFMVYLLSDHVARVSGQVFHYETRIV